MGHQAGFIWKKGRSWFGRWRDDVMIDGKLVRKQQCRKLADVCDRYRSKKDVRPLLDEILSPLNNGRADARGTFALAEYVRLHYLPWAEKNLKPSTFYGYSHIFKHYLEARLAARLTLRDFRTVDATNLLELVHRQTGVGRKHLHHIKALLSGVFRRAISQGVIDGPNPIREADIPRSANGPKETRAATVEEVLAMLALASLSLKAKAAIGLCFFCGLRPGEARGAEWQDYDGTNLRIRQSVWRSYTTTPKTEESAKSLPVIEPLAGILVQLREASGNPAGGPILRGDVSGRPLSLDNLAWREVRPALSEAKIAWAGWYSLRRGVATALSQIAHNPTPASLLLRHKGIGMTLEHYIKPDTQSMTDAMRLLEILCSRQSGEAIQ
jgi:integrase